MDTLTFPQRTLDRARRILRPTPKQTFLMYGVAVLAVGVALLTKLLVFPFAEEAFLLFQGAVFFAGWTGGSGPGLAATFLAAFCADFFFMAPRYTVFQSSPEQYVRLIQFIGEGVFISWLTGSRRCHWARSEEGRYRLWKSEEQLNSLVAGAADAIITLDAKGTVRSLNRAAERMFGYAADEIVGRDISALEPLPEPGQAAGFLQRFLKSGNKKTGTVGEFAALRKDGTIFSLDVAVNEMAGPDGPLYALIGRDMTERKERDTEVLSAISREQRRIGQDLHDDAGQTLTGLALMMDGLLDGLRSAESKHVETAERVRRGIKEVLSKIRGLSQGLMPEEVDAESFVPALRELTARVEKEQGIRCTFSCVRSMPVDDNITATNLYRIAQEALTNALKHSKAGGVQVLLTASPGLITLQISDDGQGVNGALRSSSGMGLKNMRYRAALIGGNLLIEPGDQKGTIVTCTIIKEARRGLEKEESLDRR